MNVDLNDIPYDSIHFGSKPRAKLYIDDHALRFEGNWNEISNWLKVC